MKPGYRFTMARIVRATLGRFALALFRTRFLGVENVPTSGAVLSGNHVSYMDPVLLWCGAPRPCHFMAKAELWDLKVIGWGLPRLWAFPVKRGESDRTSIATATELLTSGELIGVFPEGTRGVSGSPQLEEAHGGAAFLAMRAGVPIVPIAFVGTERVWPKGKRFPRLARVTISYGKPILPEDFADGSRKERVAATTRMLMSRIAEELESTREVS
jgi:1-acyl-sn-glycerol-3-phosphate acyltransferase